MSSRPSRPLKFAVFKRMRECNRRVNEGREIGSRGMISLRKEQRRGLARQSCGYTEKFISISIVGYFNKLPMLRRGVSFPWRDIKDKKMGRFLSHLRRG